MARERRRKYAPVFDIVGESHNNSDGTSRQDILAKCNPGDPVRVLHETNNPADPNAVLVITAYGAVGYLRRDDAAEIAPRLDAGENPHGQIYTIKGGLDDYPSYGVMVSVALEGAEHPESEPLDDDQLAYRETRTQYRPSSAAAPMRYLDERSTGETSSAKDDLFARVAMFAVVAAALWLIFS